MPLIRPSRADVHVNRPLTNISIAYMQDETSFVANQVMPMVPVQHMSDFYWTIDDAMEGFRDEMTERPPATESDGTTFNVGTSPYLAREWALHYDIADSVRDNADDQLNLDLISTGFLTRKELIRRERLFVSTYFTQTTPGTVWTFSTTGVASSPTAAASFDPTDATNTNNKTLQWSDGASTPIEDVRRAKRYVLARRGYMPNVMVLQRAVYDALLDHPDIVGRIDRGQTTGAAMANKVTLADLFEVSKILVMDAVFNSAGKGAAAPNMGFIAGKSALLAYVAPSPAMMTPSAGYQFDWVNGRYRGIQRIRMELKHADRLEITSYLAPTLIAKDLGFFFNGIVA